MNFRKALLLLLLPLFLWNGCSAQEEKSSIPSPVLEDPLFFIKGQIAAWVRNILEDSQGNLWLGTNQYGILQYDGDSLTYFAGIEENRFGRITGIIEDAEGYLWFGTYIGLIKYDGATFTNLSENLDHADKEIWSFMKDKNETFWIGTMNGVQQYDGSQFSTFPIPKASVQDTNTILSYDRIAGILEDRSGTIWFATDGFGITRYDPVSGEFSFLTKKDGLCDNNVAALLEDSNGTIWIGTMFGGICQYHPNTGKITQMEAVEGEEVYGMYEDKAGNVWFSSEGFGVYQYHLNTGELTKFYKKEGLSSGGIICFYEDQEGKLWLGGWGGLFRYDASREIPFFSIAKDGPW